MPIKTTDTFLINSNNESLQVSAENLKGSNGFLLVTRGNKSYKCPVSDVLSKVADNDRLLVNRSNRSYKITGKEIRDWFTPPQLIPNITWSGTRTVSGSSPVNESTFYSGNADIGCVFRPEDNGIKAELVGTFSGFWRVTSIIYKAWTSNIADGDWADSKYGADRASLTYSRGQGSQASNSTSIFKQYNTDLELVGTGLLNGALGLYALEIRLSRSNNPAPAYADEIAVSGLEVYGYEVDSEGNPV